LICVLTLIFNPSLNKTNAKRIKINISKIFYHPAIKLSKNIIAVKTVEIFSFQRKILITLKQLL